MQRRSQKCLYIKLVVKDILRALNDETGNRVEDSKEIVKILNKQVKSVFEKDNVIVPDITELKERVKEVIVKSEKYNWEDLTNLNENVVLCKLQNLNEHKGLTK